MQHFVGHEQEDNQSSSHEEDRVRLPVEAGTPKDESDNDNEYMRERNALQRGQRYYYRVTEMYRKRRSPGTREVVEENTGCTKHIHDTYRGCHSHLHQQHTSMNVRAPLSRSNRCPINVTTNAVAAKVTRGSGVGMSESRIMQTSEETYMVELLSFV